MNISIILEGMDFDLDIDITTYPSYRPATRNHPEEGEDAEYNIKSCDHGVKFGGKEWRDFDLDEKVYYNDLVMKANELKHNDHSYEEHEIILEVIAEELRR
jgi:hypothetical protein